MREIPESVLAGVVALLRPYCKRLTAARLTQMLTGEAQDNLKPVRQIAEENGINLFSLHHFIKRNNIPPRGYAAGEDDVQRARASRAVLRSKLTS